MAKKIIISGRYLAEDDLQLLRPEEFEFVLLPKPDMMTEEDIARLHHEAQDASLTIISMFGSSPQRLGRLALNKICTPKAYWSFDSHHQWRIERDFQHIFDAMFIAHSPYLKFFDPDRSHWLPCPYTRFGTAEALNLLRTDPFTQGKELDVIFPHKSYSVTLRGHMAAHIKTLLAGKKYFLGEVESGQAYARKLQSAKVVLNIPLIDDLNIRNFEAWLFNRILLTCYTPDMARIKDLPAATVFFKPDFSDFTARLEQAIELAELPCNTAPMVLNGHMQIHRYAELINAVLGTKLVVQEVSAGKPETPKADNSPVPVPRAEGHALNIGVTALSKKTIAASPRFCATRLQIEDNIGEAIHIHWRDLRIDYTVEEFLNLDRAARRSIKEMGIRAIPLSEKEHRLAQSFLDDMGSLKQIVCGGEVVWKNLDDLRTLVKTDAGWKSVTLQESPAWALMQGNIDRYAEYHKQFPNQERTREDFKQLVQSIVQNGYPFNGEFIIVHEGEPYIRDGQHRAVVLRYLFGNIKIPVYMLKFKKGFHGRMNLAKRGGLFAKVEPVDINRLVYVRMDGIGDAILANSVLERLPEVFPKAEITVVCDEACVELYEACPLVARVIPLNKRALEEPDYLAKAVKLLKACRPDLILHTTQSPTAGAHALSIMPGVPVIGTRGDSINLARPEEKSVWESKYLDLVQTSQTGSDSELERHNTWLRYLGIDKADARPHLWLTEAGRVEADEIWKENGFLPERTIALVPKSAVAQACSRFAEAMPSICRENNFSVVLLGGSNDEDYEALAQHFKDKNIPVANLAGRLSLLGSAAYLAQCRLLVGIDTGLAHIANVLGVSSTVILGGKHFGRFMPYSSKSTVICLPLSCYGCLTRCKYEKVHCIYDIAPEVITRAVEYTLGLSDEKMARPRLYIQNAETWPDLEGLPKYKMPNEFIKERKKSQKGLEVIINA